MGNVHANIRPGGLAQRELVDALSMAFRALYGICAKLDADTGVPLGGGGTPTYVTNCWNALINVTIEDSKGNRISRGQAVSSTIEEHHIITPLGISYAALNAALYQWHNAWETLCEQLDTDVLTFSNYEATAWTATVLQQFENIKGNSVGNGTSNFWFRPGGMFNENEFIECLYGMFYSIYKLTNDGTTTGLDGDGTVTDTDYEALWYTACCTLLIQNRAGSTIGVSR